MAGETPDLVFLASLDDFTPDEHPTSPFVPRHWYIQADISASNKARNLKSSSVHTNVYIQCTGCHQLSQVYEFKEWNYVPCPRCNRRLENPFLDSTLTFPPASELSSRTFPASSAVVDAKQAFVTASAPVPSSTPTTILQHMKESGPQTIGQLHKVEQLEIKTTKAAADIKSDKTMKVCPECYTIFDETYGPVCRKCDLVSFSCYCCRKRLHQPKSVMCFACMQTAKRLSNAR